MALLVDSFLHRNQTAAQVLAALREHGVTVAIEVGAGGRLLLTAGSHVLPLVGFELDAVHSYLAAHKAAMVKLIKAEPPAAAPEDVPWSGSAAWRVVVPVADTPPQPCPPAPLGSVPSDPPRSKPGPLDAFSVVGR